MHDTIGDARANVLLVEDDVDVAELYAAWLAGDHDVTVVHTCAAARERFDAPVDVALLDRDLPDGTGDDLLADVRRAELGWRVAMVTVAEPGLDVVDMGFDDYLVKPVTRSELNEAVDRLLAQATYREALSAFYALSSKLALLETHRSRAELVEIEEYAALKDRYEELDDELGEMVQALSETQVYAELASLSPAGDAPPTGGDA